MRAIGILMLLALLMGAASAFSPSDYQYHINVSVNSWHYSQNGIIGGPVAWAEIPLSVFHGYVFHGMSSGGADLGEVPIILSVTGTNSILIRNTTINGAAWSYVFIGWQSQPAFGSFSNSAFAIYNTSRNWTFPSPSSNLPGGFNLLQQSTDQVRYFNVTYRDIVIVTNASLANRTWNMTLVRGTLNYVNFQRFFVNSTPTGRLMVTSVGTPIVSPSVSVTSPWPINGLSAFGETEIYFSSTWSGNSLIAGEIHANQSTLANSSASSGLAFSASGEKTIAFSMSGAGKASVQFLPAFTRDINETSTIPNLNWTTSSSNCFTKLIPVTGINWSVNFTTSAYPGYNGLAHTISLPANFINLTIPYQSGMDGIKGLHICDDIYLEDQYGYEIPYWLRSCGQQSVDLIVANTSLGPLNVGDSLIVRYGQAQGGLYPYSNISIKNSWMISNKATGNFIVPASNSMLITLTGVLNIDSSINTYDTGATYLNQHLTYSSGRWRAFANAVNGIATSEYGETEYFSFISGQDKGIIGKQISITWLGIAEHVTNTTNDYSQGFGSGGYVINMSLLHGIKANITKLATNNYNHTFTWYTASNCKTPIPIGGPGITQGINDTGTLINSTKNSSIWGDPNATMLLLSGSAKFFDMTIPVSMLFLMGIFEVMLIALTFATENEWIVIFSLLGSNLIGIAATIGTFRSGGVGAAFLLVSVISAGFYVIKNSSKWWHR